MPHKPWKQLLFFWATSLWFAIVTLFTFAADSNSQEVLQPYAPPVLHSFLDSASVYPESVTVDQSSGTFFVGSVKEGTIYKGKIARPSLEVFSPRGADGRSIATGMFFADNRLVVVGDKPACSLSTTPKPVVSFRSWIMVYVQARRS